MGPPENPLKRLVHEIHHRSLWQVLAIYVAAAWVVFEVVQTLTEGLGLPDWVPPLAFVLLLIGLPIVLATAFVQQGAPELGQTGRGARWHEIDLGAPDSGRRSAHRVFTWRNSAWLGIGAFALVGLATTGYMASRTLGVGPFATPLSAGELDEQDRVVLADFEAQAGDSILAYAVTEAFRVDLSQSASVRLADEARVHEVVRLMDRDPDAPLDLAAAREVARREGLPAAIGAEIHRVGNTFTLSARLVAAESGEELVSVRETAKGEDAVIPAIERLSRSLRERTGESLRTVRQTPPLQRVRTASLEALILFTEGTLANRSGDNERCVTLMTEALARDSLFAAAYRRRAACRINRGQVAQAVADLRRAFELRDRMTPRTRALTSFSYHSVVTGEIQKGIEVAQAYLDHDPEHHGIRNNLGLAYGLFGQHARAEEVIRPLVAERPTEIYWGNLFESQLNQGKLAEAETTLDEWEEWSGNRTWGWHVWHARLAFLRGDYGAAERHLMESKEKRRGNLGSRAVASRLLGQVSLARGQLSGAESQFSEALDLYEEAGDVRGYHTAVHFLAYAQVWVRGDSARAREVLDMGLSQHPLESLELRDRSYHVWAMAYAMAGRPERARPLLQALRDSLPRETWGWGLGLTTRLAGAWIAVAEGRLNDATLDLRRSNVPRQFERLGSVAMGLIHERLAQPDSAIAHYERFLTTPAARALALSPYLGFVLERLGQLHEETGEVEEAIEYYTRFVELWEDADPELQPRVEEARRRVAALIRLQSEGR